MKDVEDKTAFITGGASGVGLGMAKVFANAGMKVAIADIRQDHLDAAMGHFSNTNFQVHPIRLDVTSRKGVAEGADEAEKRFGNIHLVCNNAGINLFAPIDESTYEDWDWVMGVNLGGVVNGVRTFVPRMKAHGEGGHIVNTGSMASFITSAIPGVYNTAKFAVRGLTESLRWALQDKGIGVSLLCPGLVQSAIHESDKIRPADLKHDMAHVSEDFTKRLPEVHKLGMDPVEVGEKVLAGIRRNDLYIFPHPEFKDELRGIFDEVLEAFPPMTEADKNAPRMPFEKMRQENAMRTRKKK